MKGQGPGPFLRAARPRAGVLDGDAPVWKFDLCCRHRGEGRVAHTALVMHSARVDGKPRQKLIKRFATIRSCCIADPFNATAWWHDIESTFAGWEETFCDEGGWLVRDKAAIVANLRAVVPKPRPSARRPFVEWLAAKEREEKEAWDRYYRERRAESDRWRAEHERRQAEEEGRRQEQRRKAEEQAYEFLFGRGRDEPTAEDYAWLDANPAMPIAGIKAAYRRQAMRYHPDRNPGDAEAEAKFRKVQAAWERIEKAEQRRAG